MSVTVQVNVCLWECLDTQATLSILGEEGCCCTVSSELLWRTRGAWLCQVAALKAPMLAFPLLHTFVQAAFWSLCLFLPFFLFHILLFTLFVLLYPPNVTAVQDLCRSILSVYDLSLPHITFLRSPLSCWVKTQHISVRRVLIAVEELVDRSYCGPVRRCPGR